MMRAGLAALALCASGCFTLSTTDVLVKDPHAVELRTENDEPVLAEGEAMGAFQSSDRWNLLAPEPFTIHAEREDQGELTLRCDSCDRDVELLHADHWTLPTTSWSVDVERTGVTVDYALCMRSRGRHCFTDAMPRLAVPIADVVEVRRRVEPVRIWGWMLLVASAASLAMTSVLMLEPHMGSFQDRAPWAAAALVPTITFGAMGLWEVLSPVREQVWRPGEN